MFIKLQHFAHIFARFKQMKPSGVNAGLGGCHFDDIGQSAVCFPCFAAALQQYGISTFQAKRRNLNQCIGPGFEDDSDHTNRAADLVKPQPFVKFRRQKFLSHRFGQADKAVDTLDNLSQLFIIKLQPFQQRSRQIFVFASFQINLVPSDDFIPVLLQLFRDQPQGEVLFVLFFTG